MGFPLMRMIEEVGGGVRGGKKLKAVIPGGSSCPVLKSGGVRPADGLRFAGKGQEHAGFGRRSDHGSGYLLVKALLRIMRFYAHESCGWCIPCREGTAWLKKLLIRLPRSGGTSRDINLIGDLAKNMLGRTFAAGRCGAMPTI